MRVRQLDALRTLAVTMVILSHLGPPPADGPRLVVLAIEWFRAYGHWGVDLFFVLSGFLVSGLLFREYAKRSTVDVTRFLIRRGLKIYPAFYAFLAVTIPLRLRLGDTITTGQVWREALFVQNYGQGVWTHTWSLAVEEHFYLLLALLVAYLCRRSSSDPFRPLPAIFLAVAVVATTARAITWWTSPFTVQTHTFPTHLRLDALLFGVLLSYRYHVDPSFRPRVAARRWWMVAAGLVILWLSQQLGQSLTYVVGTALIYLGFGAIVLAAVCAPSNRPWHPAAQFIALVGTFSYSIYLWHTADFAFGNVFLRKAGLDHANYYAILAFKVATAFVVGIVMSKLVELPVLAVRDRLFPARGQGSLG